MRRPSGGPVLRGHDVLDVVQPRHRQLRLDRGLQVPGQRAFRRRLLPGHVLAHVQQQQHLHAGHVGELFQK